MQTIDELARASGMKENRLHTILKNVNERRKLHRLSRRGWSIKEKNSPWLAEAIVPFRIWLMHKDTYFNPQQDAKQKSKSMEDFLKKYPQFKSRD